MCAELVVIMMMEAHPGFSMLLERRAQPDAQPGCFQYWYLVSSQVYCCITKDTPVSSVVSDRIPLRNDGT